MGRKSSAVVTLGMMSYRDTFEIHADPERLLILAKAGCSPALVRLLDRYRDPLVEQLQGRIGRRLQVKLDIDDLLQDVSLEACRDIGSFRGSTEGEFLCWLRKIVATTFMNQLRRYFGTERRNLLREQHLVATDDSARSRVHEPIAPDTSPSQRAVQRERATRLAGAIELLPALYREVVVLRHLQALSFGDVARRMNRTEDSVKNMWFRALKQLRGLLGDMP
jgi:RNA polymerase sigma-70 factor (ECF subfamily)